MSARRVHFSDRRQRFIAFAPTEFRQGITDIEPPSNYCAGDFWLQESLQHMKCKLTDVCLPTGVGCSRMHEKHHEIGRLQVQSVW